MASRVLDFARRRKRRELPSSLPNAAASAVVVASCTIDQAITEYLEYLKRRGGDLGNVDRVRRHLPPEIGGLVRRQAHGARLRQAGTAISQRPAWCRARSTASMPRSRRRLTWRRARTSGSSGGRGTWRSRRCPTPPRRATSSSTKRTFTAWSQRLYAHSKEFGLLVEVIAQTGARVACQAAGLEVGDLKMHRTAPSLMMPSSKKDRGRSRSKAARCQFTGRAGAAAAGARQGQAC